MGQLKVGVDTPAVARGQLPDVSVLAQQRTHLSATSRYLRTAGIGDQERLELGPIHLT